MALATASSSGTLNEMTMDTLAENLVEAGQNLRFATLALRSCFTVNASSVRQFVELRGQVSEDAAAYREQIAPLAMASTQSVKEFMDYFLELSMNEVFDIIEDIGHSARTCEKLMTLNKDTHQVIAVKFRQKEDAMDKVLSACEMQKKKLAAQAEELANRAASKRNWAVGLCFIPIVGAIASPILADSAGKDTIQAIAAKEEAQLAVNASYALKTVLAPAIHKYTLAMDTVANTFMLLASECESFSGHTDKVAKLSGGRRKEVFYKMMNVKAKKVTKACEQYMAFATEAESDVKSLPKSSTNYVQQWLAQQKKDQNSPTFMERLRELGNSLPEKVQALTGASS